MKPSGQLQIMSMPFRTIHVAPFEHMLKPSGQYVTCGCVTAVEISQANPMKKFEIFAHILCNNILIPENPAGQKHSKLWSFIIEQSPPF